MNFARPCPLGMSIEILKKSDLDLKLCLETFKSSPFTLKTFLKVREDCLNHHLSQLGDDYLGIITVVIRGMFCDILRQTFTIFNDKLAEKDIFIFINHNIFKIAMDLRAILKESKCSRPQLTHMWNSTILAGEALKQFSADFSALLDDVFVEKMFEMIKTEMNEHLNTLDTIEFVGEIDISAGRYDLNTTIALNSVVDAINQIKLCPISSELKEKVMKEIRNHPKLTENIKNWAVNQF